MGPGPLPNGAEATGTGEGGDYGRLRALSGRGPAPAVPARDPAQHSFNYPVAILGKWHGNKYRFLQRFHSDDPDALEPEFDAPFARLEYVGRDCFDVSWHRHTGEWWCLYRSVSLTEALQLIESDGHLHPV
jgi:hypothetical protein